MRDLGTLSESGSDKGSDACAINERGLIVGNSRGEAIVWRNRRITRLGMSLGSGAWSNLYWYCSPEALNDKGQIVGEGGFGQSAHAALWQNGELRDLGTLGGSWSAASAIDERGQVAGWSHTKTGEWTRAHAFVWADGVITDLGTLGGRSSSANAINDRGQIVGNSETGEPRVGGYVPSHAVLWTLRSG